MNDDTEIGWQFHNGTKHPNGDLLNPAHTYDPIHRPHPYKVYNECLQKIPLNLDKSQTGALALDALSKIAPSYQSFLSLGMISRVAYFAAGITKVIHIPGMGDVEFRAAACTGALYHIEVYLVCGDDIDGLEAGVYHYDPHNMNFEMLRSGDLRHIVAASTHDEAVLHAPLLMVFTDIFTRNSVKYQAREYRHAFWDSGTIIANALAVCNAHGVASKLVLGYVDSEINRLLGLDTSKEVSLALLAIGSSGAKVESKHSELEELDFQTEPLSNYYHDNPAILKMHNNSCLHSTEQVQNWQKSLAGKVVRHYAKSGEVIPLTHSTERGLPIEQVIMRRGSVRRFKREPISFLQLSMILYHSLDGMISADFLNGCGGSLVDAYLAVNSVDGLRSGTYFYRRDRQGGGLEPLEYGEIRRDVGHLGLDQRLASDCSAAVFMMSNLGEVFDLFGNRGYRAAMMEAGIIGGKIYLASHALGLGASGLTFYDDESVEFFMPHSENKSMMFLALVGKRAKHKLV